MKNRVSGSAHPFSIRVLWSSTKSLRTSMFCHGSCGTKVNGNKSAPSTSRQQSIQSIQFLRIMVTISPQFPVHLWLVASASLQPSIPNNGENKKCFKPPSRSFITVSLWGANDSCCSISVAISVNATPQLASCLLRQHPMAWHVQLGIQMG